MKKFTLLLLILIPLFSYSQTIFINEIHYDNDGGDVNEGIEIAGPAGTDLSSFSLILYNGNGGAVYNTEALSGVIPDLQNGFGTVFFSILGLQNGSPDGVAFVDGSNQVIQFLSYEGTITGVGGAADGLLSQDLGVAESSTTPEGLSLQLVGEGTTYSDFTWATEASSSYDAINLGQTFGMSEPTIFINEIHYDNESGDVNEGIEVAGTAGTDLAGWALLMYNGSNGTLYNTVNLSGVVPDQDSGYGTLSFSISGIQNGAPDGVALVNAEDEIIQFLSYEGNFVAVGGLADGLESVDIGISETGSTSADFSLQLTGEGQSYESFTWIAEASTFGAINTSQSFGEGNPDPDPDPEPVSGLLFINEIHYDNASTDSNEGIEVAGTAGLDLSGWTLILYNGNGGTAYNTVNLSGTLPEQQAGFGTAFFAISGLQNGSPDGVALADPDNNLIQFLSYEGSFTAIGGAADGIQSEDIGVEETSSTAIGLSLQLEGAGSSYEDFSWAEVTTSTYDLVNVNQTFESPVQHVFINEIHYDNASTDLGEGVEVAGNAGIDLAGWSLVLYNGSGGAPYNTVALSGLIPDQDNGYGTVSYSISGIQNGSPDGVALVSPDSVVQFLSYEGTMLAVGGPADGLQSEEISQSETSSTPEGQSLQLVGTGQAYSDFEWAAPQNNTFGLVNTLQSFGGPIVVEPPVSDTVTVAQARQLPLNSEVVLLAVLTATDHFGGPSYLQDETAGIALFDPIVQGEGLFDIGDQVWVSAVVGEYSGQIQLVNVESVELVNSGVEIIPPVVTLDQLGDYEGQLVTISDYTFDVSEGVLFPNTNYNITDLTATAEVRIDGNTDLVGRNRPEIPTTITGVVGRYQTFLQLLPRFIADLPGNTPYESGGSDIPYNQTLDIATWNMEFFGTTISGYGPSDVTLQASNAATVLSALNADIIAVQEVSNDELLQSIVDGMTNYQLVCSDVYSYSFEEPDPNNPFPAQKLCYIYDTSVANLVSERAVFDEFYTQARQGEITDLDDYPTSSGASSFWSSGRLPYQLIADVTVMGTTKRINLINLHAKSGSSSSDLTRRAYDLAVLKDSLDADYSSDAVVILGDYNDNVTTSIGGGPSTYEVILNDTDNFDAITRSLSESFTPTYIGGSGSTIDHITISNELFEDVIEGSEAIYFPFNSIENYEGTTSDHLPVVARFDIVPPVEAEITEEQTVFLGYGPMESTLLTATPIGGAAPYTFAWSNGESTATITIAPEESTTYSVIITDANGESVEASSLVNVVDVSCGSWRGHRKVQLCFRGNSLCVPELVATKLISRGAVLGDCNEEESIRLSHFEVSPNPFRDQVNLSLKSNKDASVGVIIKSLWTGRTVYQGDEVVMSGDNEFNIDLSDERCGFYVLIITNQATGRVEKILRLYKR
ncbi:MAG: DUF5689 domain-containing protein [Reichenbachiella sp.]|uniref:DUF5689 domain-containing protein n=1 Tax=Reichenbachiella sp. TaxID=2184521 RepID=UPI0032987815